MKTTIILVTLLILPIISCENSQNVNTNRQFALIDSLKVHDNKFQKRIFRNDSYKIKLNTKVPDYVGNIYGLVEGSESIYLSDKESIYSYKNGAFKNVYTPSKGRGPNEVPQIFRFDIINDSLITIAGYPELRILIHDLERDTTNLINTEYRGNVISDSEGNIYGENTNNKSSNMITKFTSKGDSVASFGEFFKNQDISLNMFDYYWTYNKKYNTIIIGFMYVGYYVAINMDGEIIYIVESIQYPGTMPTFVNTGDMAYIDEEGKNIMNWITSNNDETHIYTASAMNRKEEIYGALIDVIETNTGEYKFSYVLKEKLHWPILLLDDYSIASITENYDLIIWERIR
jgi:hypothetical protein